jgi:hypothetical protein
MVGLSASLFAVSQSREGVIAVEAGGPEYGMVADCPYNHLDTGLGKHRLLRVCVLTGLDCHSHHVSDAIKWINCCSWQVSPERPTTLMR